MRPANEGSKIINFELRSLSFGKDKEKGLKVVQGALKDSIFNDEMEIKVEVGELLSNNTLKSENGKVTKFPQNSYKTVMKNNKTRGTGKVIEIKNKTDKDERNIG